jgi:hypothetical protein
VFEREGERGEGGRGEEREKRDGERETFVLIE